MAVRLMVCSSAPFPDTPAVPVRRPAYGASDGPSGWFPGRSARPRLYRSRGSVAKAPEPGPTACGPALSVMAQKACKLSSLRGDALSGRSGRALFLFRLAQGNLQFVVAAGVPGVLSLRSSQFPHESLLARRLVK